MMNLHQKLSSVRYPRLAQVQISCNSCAILVYLIPFLATVATSCSCSISYRSLLLQQHQDQHRTSSSCCKLYVMDDIEAYNFFRSSPCTQSGADSSPIFRAGGHISFFEERLRQVGHVSNFHILNISATQNYLIYDTLTKLFSFVNA